MSGTTYDYGEDAPGGPGTPAVALKAFVAGAFPRLAHAHFKRTDEGTGFVVYTYTHASRGQMILNFEQFGDSWGIATSTSCASLESWARGEAQ